MPTDSQGAGRSNDTGGVINFQAVDGNTGRQRFLCAAVKNQSTVYRQSSDGINRRTAGTQCTAVADGNATRITAKLTYGI